MTVPTDSVNEHSADSFATEPLRGRGSNESNVVLELTEGVNEVEQIAELLESNQASLFFGIFTLLYIEVVSENHRKQYGWYFPTAVGFAGLLTVLAQVVLAVCLCIVVVTRDGHGFCTLPGNAQGGTNRQRLIMFGVASWFTAQLVLRFLQQRTASLAKLEYTSKILDRHSRLDFLFNIDSAWQVIYVSSLYIFNLFMIFYVEKENEFDMIFNCVAMEFIIQMDSAFVETFRAHFHICPHAANKLNKTSTGKIAACLSYIIRNATYLLSAVFPLLSITFLIYGPICKPK